MVLASMWGSRTYRGTPRFQYLEYPASRGKIHIKSANPYVEPFFDSGFMNDKADFAPIRWSYKKTREVARRMDGVCPVLVIF